MAEDPGRYPVMAALDKFMADPESRAVTSAMPILTELMRACPGFGGQQEDVTEALVLMLDKMHPDVSRLFEATYQMDIYCDTCRSIAKPDTKAGGRESMVYIPMERDFITIGITGDHLEQFLSGHMTRLNGRKCPGCGIVSGTSAVTSQTPAVAMTIARLIKPPEILVITFNKYNEKWLGPNYGQNIVIAPIGGGRASYSLTGVIRHFGGRDSGHYNAVCRRPSGIWLFDDTVVQAAEFQPSVSDYMLIYSRLAPGSEKIENLSP